MTVPPAGGMAAVVSTTWAAWQTPAMQTSPEPQEVPSGAAGFEQAPVVALHVPAVWQRSSGVQTMGFDPAHAPAWHVSVSVQAFPSLQVVPLTAFDQVVVLVAGVQTWQELAGFTAPDA